MNVLFTLGWHCWLASPTKPLVSAKNKPQCPIVFHMGSEDQTPVLMLLKKAPTFTIELLSSLQERTLQKSIKSLLIAYVHILN